MIEVRHGELLPWRELASFEENNQQLLGKAGACATFVGTMRDFNEGDEVSGMFLEHYPGMTEKHLAAIREQAMNQWPLLEALIVHRIGTIAPGDAIVLVATWSAHRAAAFDASRFIMEDLKSRAPFWKKETLTDGERWVERNTPGYSN